MSGSGQADPLTWKNTVTRLADASDMPHRAAVITQAAPIPSVSKSNEPGLNAESPVPTLAMEDRHPQNDKTDEASSPHHREVNHDSLMQRGFLKCVATCFGLVDDAPELRAQPLQDAAHSVNQASSSVTRPRSRRNKSDIAVSYRPAPIDIRDRAGHIHVGGDRTVFQEVPDLAMDNGRLSATMDGAPLTLRWFANHQSHMSLRDTPRPVALYHEYVPYDWSEWLRRRARRRLQDQAR